jgi:hypothetical protein
MIVDRPEPEIVINGVKLTSAQAMTVRVALSAADWDCGADELSQQLSAGYRARAREVFEIMRRERAQMNTMKPSAKVRPAVSPDILVVTAGGGTGPITPATDGVPTDGN